MSAWEAVRDRLEGELASLGDGEFVVVSEPEPPRAPARGLLRRRPASDQVRWVQVRRDGDLAYAECVGATSFGGDWDVDAATHQRLRDLGWLAPGDDDPTGTQPSYPAYWCVLPHAEAARLAGLARDALALLGADPATLEWRRGA